MDSPQFGSGWCVLPNRVLRRLPFHSFNNSVLFTSKLTPITFDTPQGNTTEGSRWEVEASSAATLIFRGT
jgi:hypothetical protein